MSENFMNIIKLTTENVKRLQAVEITPQGNLIVLGGKNGQGKSSVLDSIEMALSGGEPPKMPVRRGEEKARVVVDLGEIVVRRSFTAGGGTSLVVTNADGVKQSSPQTILDKLTGKLTFDPLAFSRQKPKEQSETLRALVGLDFTKQDAEREEIFSNRTNVNREAKALESRMQSMPTHGGLPDAEISTAEILQEQETASKTNAENERVRVRVGNLRSNAAVYAQAVERTKAEMLKLNAVLNNQEDDAKTAKNTAADAEKELSSLVDIDLTPFRAKVSQAEENNAKIRANRARVALVAEYKTKSALSDNLTKKLEAIDAAKRKAITAAKWPIEGLTFDTAGGVVLGGIPFEQCSSAEQLKVSVSIGLALNPTLRVLLIRDGSLLDDASLAMVAEMAQKANAQVWIERVGTDSATSVVIDDGQVVQPKEAA